MHQDLEALEIVCRHYNSEYRNDALRISKNACRRVTRALSKKSAEAYEARREAEAWRIISIAWEERYRSLLKAIKTLG